MCGGGSGGKTAQEKEYDAIQVEKAKTELSNQQELQPLLKANLQQSAADSASSRAIQDRTYDLIYNGGKGTPLAGSQEGQAQAAFQQFQQSQHLAGVQQQLADMQLEAAKNGGKASPEQAALIDQQTAASQASGESDINRWLQQSQRQIQEENAQAAGLRATDAPVTANIGRAAEEATRQQGQLTLGLQGANAAAKLNYPLSAQGVQNQTVSSMSQIAGAAQQFQAALQQQSQQNRLALQQNPVSNSLGFSQLPTNLSSGAPVNQSNTVGQVGQAAGGIGSLISAYNQTSDRRLKSNIVRVGTHRLGIGLYEYDLFGKRTSGVMADEVLNVMPDAVSIDSSGHYMVNYALLGAP